MSLSSVGVIPYRRLTDPLKLPYGPTSTRTRVPAGFIPTEATSFRVTNMGPGWVRLRGANSENSNNPATLTITVDQGWLFPPGFSGTFTTQFPEYMATISPDGANGVLEITYGIGGSGESVGQLVAAGGSTGGNVVVTNTPLPVTVTGNVSVNDTGGSLTVDTPQLPATLGAKTGANSLAVVPATDALFAVADRGAASIATGQAQVNNTTAVQVVPARATRRRVTLAPSTQFTYFVGNAGVTATTGFAVLNGGAVTLDTTAAVFVIANATGPMTFVETF